MMAIIRKLILAIIFISNIYYCYGQFVKVADRVIVAGYVFDGVTSEPIPYVNIYVKKTRIGTITDTAGFFLLSAKLNDTITISSIGYSNKYVVLNDTVADNTKPLIIFLDTRIYELKSVNVIALHRYKQLEYEIKNMKLPEDDYTNAAKNFPFKPRDVDFYPNRDLSVAGLVLHPISALYEMFSKEGKEKQKLEELKKFDEQEEILLSKIDVRFIMEVTNMERDEVNVFLKWCNFSPEFLLSMSSYELAMLISHKYEQYKQYKLRR